MSKAVHAPSTSTAESTSASGLHELSYILYNVASVCLKSYKSILFLFILIL